MRKLTETEQHALNILVDRGSICLGDAASSEIGREFDNTMHALIRKKRAFAESTDDGLRYFPTVAGRNHAS